MNTFILKESKAYINDFLSYAVKTANEIFVNGNLVDSFEDMDDQMSLSKNITIIRPAL